MREILFRGKRIDNGEWTEGFYVKCRGHSYILPVYDIDHGFDERYSEWIEVDPETICQYIGYEDLRKKKVFEHDIVFYEDGGCHGCIVFRNGCFSVDWEGSRPDLKSDIHFWFTERRMYVVGNIFDNPEPINENEFI